LQTHNAKALKKTADSAYTSIHADNIKKAAAAAATADPLRLFFSPSHNYSMNPSLSVVLVDKPSDVNVILGQTHFIKSVEDIYEALVNAVPGIRFGLAFCEASGDCLIRVEGTDNTLKALAAENALKIGAGHSFIILLKDAYPLNVLNSVKNVPEVCRVICRQPPTP